MQSSTNLGDILARKEAGIRELESRRQRQGKKLADWVEDTPDAIEQGLATLRRRLTKRYCHARELNIEWMHILESCSRCAIATLLRDPSERTEQLRASAPFAPPKNH